MFLKVPGGWIGTDPRPKGARLQSRVTGEGPDIRIVDLLGTELPDARVIEMPGGHAPNVVSKERFPRELDLFQGGPPPQGRA